MDCLVGNLILSGGEKVVIIFSDGRKENAVYKDTYGYTHRFVLDNGNEMKLSNHFMKMRDISVSLRKE
ncbi:MAG: hypothetical protein ACOX3X_05800 [Eubacteriales bacterium]|jgi:hypothetical protein